MTTQNARQCARCGTAVPTERELDPVHNCPHNVDCRLSALPNKVGQIYCVECEAARVRRGDISLLIRGRQ